MEHLASDAPPLGEIDGLAYIAESALVVNRSRDRITDLDTLPFPLRRPDLGYRTTGMFGGTYPVDVHPPKGFYVLASRGCQFNCRFCFNESMWQRKRFVRSAASVRTEIESLISEYQIESVIFMDPDLFGTRNHAQELLGAIEELGLRWGAETTVRSLDEELIDHAARAGCKSLTIGYETADISLLDKPYDIDRAIQITAVLRRHGIFVHGAFMIGFPVDDWRSVWSTIRLARSVDPDVMVLSLLKPWKGTQSYNDSLARGWITEANELHRLTFWQWPAVPTERLGRMELLLGYWLANLIFFVHPA